MTGNPQAGLGANRFDIVEAIGDVNYGDTLTLRVAGVLIGERPIEGASYAGNWKVEPLPIPTSRDAGAGRGAGERRN
jgi:hypothetical protein